VKKKSDVKDSIGYDSIYMKSPLKANLSSWEPDQALSGDGSGNGE